MKKLLITALLTAATSGSLFAQAQIGFFNSSSTAIFLSNGATTNKLFGSAGTYDMGLYLGSSSATAIGQMQLVDVVANVNIPAATSFNAGLFGGGTIDSPGNVANTINFAAGTEYAFYVAVWATAGGSDYLTAVGAGVANGLSALGFVTPTPVPAGAPNVFGTSAGQIGSFTATSITPEPATIALGGLGAAALLMFRRRK